VVFEELGGALNADPVQWVREGFFGVRGIGGATASVCRRTAAIST